MGRHGTHGVCESHFVCHELAHAAARAAFRIGRKRFADRASRSADQVDVDRAGADHHRSCRLAACGLRFGNFCGSARGGDVVRAGLGCVSCDGRSGYHTDRRDGEGHATGVCGAGAKQSRGESHVGGGDRIGSGQCGGFADRPQERLSVGSQSAQAVSCTILRNFLRHLGDRAGVVRAGSECAGLDRSLPDAGSQRMESDGGFVGERVGSVAAKRGVGGHDRRRAWHCAAVDRGKISSPKSMDAIGNGLGFGNDCGFFQQSWICDRRVDRLGMAAPIGIERGGL